MRLNKYLAASGVASRRGADQLIEDGRVTVNGKVAKTGMQVTEKDVVTVNGKTISGGEAKEYWLVNKPRGVVSTAIDDRGRPTVVDMVQSKARLYPVGRLDEDSEGLILLTNDGDLAFKLTHPKFQVEKVYQVRIMGNLTESKIKRFETGVRLEDGMTAPAKVEKIAHQLLAITIREGRKRQIRRMCSVLGLEVTELKRVKMGTLELGELKTGAKRKLTEEELKELKQLVGE